MSNLSSRDIEQAKKRLNQRIWRFKKPYTQLQKDRDIFTIIAALDVKDAEIAKLRKVAEAARICTKGSLLYRIHGGVGLSAALKEAGYE